MRRLYPSVSRDISSSSGWFSNRAKSSLPFFSFSMSSGSYPASRCTSASGCRSWNFFTSAGRSVTPSDRLMPTSMVLLKCSSTAASSAASALSSAVIFPRELGDDLPCRRGHHAGGRAVVQLGAITRLDVRDLLRQAGTRHVQALCRLGKALRLGYDHEDLYVVKLHALPCSRRRVSPASARQCPIDQGAARRTRRRVEPRPSLFLHVCIIGSRQARPKHGTPIRRRISFLLL